MTVTRRFFTLWALITISIISPSQVSRAPAEVAREFKSERVFYKQLDLAQELVRKGDTSVLGYLDPLLGDPDRHVRANAAYVFAAFGDPRGLQILKEILNDWTCRPVGQGNPGGVNAPNAKQCYEGQVTSDRYYVVHVLGELKNKSAIDLLIPLLQDQALNYKVPWALGQIGDKAAIDPLISATFNADADVRIGAVRALAQLGAKEALPRLREMLSDRATNHLGQATTVSDAASEAIYKIQDSR